MAPRANAAPSAARTTVADQGPSALRNALRVSGGWLRRAPTQVERCGDDPERRRDRHDHQDHALGVLCLASLYGPPPSPQRATTPNQMSGNSAIGTTHARARLRG